MRYALQSFVHGSWKVLHAFLFLHLHQSDKYLIEDFYAIGAFL